MHISTNEGEKSNWNKVLAPYSKFITLSWGMWLRVAKQKWFYTFSPHPTHNSTTINLLPPQNIPFYL